MNQRIQVSYLGRINHNEYSYFYYCFPAKICLVCLLPILNPVDPITHCSDAAVDAQILRGALGSGKAEHSPKGVGYCSVPEILHHHVLVPFRSAQKFWAPTESCMLSVGADLTPLLFHF